MKIIFKNEYIEIQKLNESQYKLVIKKKPFPNYIKLLNKFTWEVLKHKKNKNEITFTAYSILSLEDTRKRAKNYIDYYLAEQLFRAGKDIINYLEGKYSITNFDMEDFIFIRGNDPQFKAFSSNPAVVCLFVNFDKIMPVVNGQLEITSPLKKDKFFSPEMKSIQSLPAYISVHSAYYSLGSLISYLLTDKFPPTDSCEAYKNHLSDIEDSKLYWALLRCLQVNPVNRYLLFI